MIHEYILLSIPLFHNKYKIPPQKHVGFIKGFGVYFAKIYILQESICRSKFYWVAILI